MLVQNLAVKWVFSGFILTFCMLTQAAYWGDNRTDNYSNGVFVSASQDAPLNKYFQASIHNAYLKNHNLYDILRLYSTNIELDIFDVRDANAWPSKTYRSGDWYVRHDPNDPGENVRCLNDGDHDYLTECLDEIMRFHNNFPTHELITIWLDKKQGWQPTSECNNGTNSPCRRPNDLDTLLLNKVGDSILFSPADLLSHSGASQLRTAAAGGGWPTMLELRGKIMVVITDAKDGNNSNLNGYLSERGDNARAFVAPKMSSGSVDYPVGMGGHYERVVFYNLAGDKRHFGPEIYSKGRISRTWGANLADSSSYDYRAFLIQNGAGDNYTHSNRYSGPLQDSSSPLYARIKPRHALDQALDRCVDGSGTGNGSTVHLWSCSTSNINQKWFAIPHSSVNTATTSGIYYLSALNSGKRADIKDHNSNNGVNIHLWDHRNSANQRWQLTRQSNGDYEIKNTLSAACMDVFAFGTNNGSNILQWFCNGYSNQRYQITSWQ